MLKHAGNTEVTYLYLTRLCHEDVLRLQVAVQNFLIVDMFNRERHLDKPIEYLVFAVAHYT